MIKKTIKFIAFSIVTFLLTVSFVLAEEVNLSDSLDQTASDSILSESDQSNSATIPTAVEIQSKLDLLEKTTPISLRLYDTQDLTSGSEIKVKARVSLLTQSDVNNFNFNWSLKKDGLDQKVDSLSQGKGKDQFSFVPISSGNYEVKVQVADSQANTRESQPITISIGDELLITFNPLEPVNGQKVLVSASGFNGASGYKWYLDGQEQKNSSPNFEFTITKSYEQAHKIKVASVNQQGIGSSKEILIPVYRPDVVLRPSSDGLTVVGQVGSSNEFLVKGDNPIILEADTPNFIDASQAQYIWYLNGQEIDQGIGKKSIYIGPQDERLKSDQNGEYQVSVIVASPDMKNIAQSKISMSKINPNSSLAAVNPEKISNQPLLAESKSFFTSLGMIRKLILPLMIIMFVVVIALGNTQPQKIE